MKKILSIFLSLAVLIGACTPSAFSAFALTDGDFSYDVLDDGTAEITDYSGGDPVVIPSILGSKTVSSIGDYAFIGKNISEVQIISTVKNIGEGAFYATYLSKISIPDSVETVGENAFLSVVSLKTVTIGAGLTSLPASALEGCTGITNITVSEDNENFSSENGVLYNKDKTALLRYPSGAESKSFTVPDGVKLIAENAFYGCTELKEITLDKDIESIEQNAFINTSVTDVYYNSTEENWKKVTVSETGNDAITNAEKHYKTDPDPDPDPDPTPEPTPTPTPAPEPTADIVIPLTAPKIKKLSAKKNSLTVKWNKNSEAQGYILQYSTSKAFKKSKTKTVTIKKKSTVKKTIKKLKSKKTYYVRVCSYNAITTSEWSKVKKIKTK